MCLAWLGRCSSKPLRFERCQRRIWQRWKLSSSISVHVVWDSNPHGFYFCLLVTVSELFQCISSMHSCRGSSVCSQRVFCRFFRLILNIGSHFAIGGDRRLKHADWRSYKRGWVLGAGGTLVLMILIQPQCWAKSVLVIGHRRNFAFRLKYAFQGGVSRTWCHASRQRLLGGATGGYAFSGILSGVCCSVLVVSRQATSTSRNTEPPLS